MADAFQRCLAVGGLFDQVSRLAQFLLKQGTDGIVVVHYQDRSVFTIYF